MNSKTKPAHGSHLYSDGDSATCLYAPQTTAHIWASIYRTTHPEDHATRDIAYTS